MNSIYYSKIGHRGTGLTNQLFTLVTGILVSIIQNKKVVICREFYNDFSNDDTTPISQVLDIPRFNSFLSRYNLTLFDFNDVNFNITNARYGKNDATIDVTNELLANFYDSSNRKLYIPRNTNLNNIKGDPIYGVKKQLSIQYTINNIPFTETVEEGVSRDVVFDLTTADWMHQFGWINSINRHTFDDILKNIPFHPTFFNLAKMPAMSGNINVLHLRVEDDAMNHGASVNKMDVAEFRKSVENKYISIIKQHVRTSDTNIILSGLNDNAVIDFMNSNGYNVVIPTKHFTNGRELNAIVDFLISKYCNNLFIGNFNMQELGGSTFSYFISIQFNDSIKQLWV
jgi:hypothetical protein